MTLDRCHTIIFIQAISYSIIVYVTVFSYWTFFEVLVDCTSTSRFPFGHPNHNPSRSITCDANKTLEDTSVEGNTFHAYSMDASIASLQILVDKLIQTQ